MDNRKVKAKAATTDREAAGTDTEVLSSRLWTHIKIRVTTWSAAKVVAAHYIEYS